MSGTIPFALPPPRRFLFTFALFRLFLLGIVLPFFSFQPFVQVPRLWVPAAQCPQCAYPNDNSFVFCQRCGYHRRRLDPRSAPPMVDVNLEEIDSRLSSLEKVVKNKSYEKQKSKLQSDLESFLASLPFSKSPLECTPNDIARFLVWKDQWGKTKVHRPSCPLFGSKSPEQCRCPTRLAAGTVDNMIGKLRSLFIDLGRGGEWNELLGIGNPASHKSIKQYLKLVQEEQAMARIRPRQAVPLFFDKIAKLCRYLRLQALSDSCSPIQRFLWARDLCFFCLDFFAGDRGSDLGRVLTKEIIASSDGKTLLFRHTFGKTLRGKDTNTFMVKKCADISVCPVSNLFLFVKLCDLMSVNLRDGYLFRTSDKKGLVSNSPFTGSTVANRLKLHLKSLGIHEGETMHSFRSGCSITLSLLGVSQEDVARHVGWKSLVTSEYYSQCTKVMDPGRAASALSNATSNVAGASPLASSVAEHFTGKNNLQHWSVAFP